MQKLSMPQDQKGYEQSDNAFDYQNGAGKSILG